MLYTQEETAFLRVKDNWVLFVNHAKLVLNGVLWLLQK